MLMILTILITAIFYENYLNNQNTQCKTIVKEAQYYCRMNNSVVLLNESQLSDENIINSMCENNSIFIYFLIEARPCVYSIGADEK